MQANDNLFPASGDNFRTVARADSDLELSLVILDLGFPVLDDGYGYDKLAADYAVVMDLFNQPLAVGKCTDTGGDCTETSQLHL